MNKHLENFIEINEPIELETDEDIYIIKKPWNDKSVILQFAEDDPLELLADITLPEELIALKHGNSKLEFIYGPLGKEKSERGRSFTFNFQGEVFDCHFTKSSDALELLAKSFIEGEAESRSGYRNLSFLKDFYEDKPFFSEFYEDPKAISFYVEGDFSKINNNYIKLSKHLNFYLQYFDRDSAQINLIPKVDEEEIDIAKDKSFIDKFPSTISSQQIDETLLEIFQVAEETVSPRLKFIFYYQIIEYCSYYYLNDDLKNSIFKLLKNPRVSDDPNFYSKIIVEEFKDFFSQRDDSVKFEKTVLTYCSIDDIKPELKHHHEHFASDIEFDGGFKINKIISDEESIDKLVKEDLRKIKNNIEKIRNVLVHLRESRENKVILPTRRNDHLIRPYLRIIRRLAENVAIHFD